MKAAFGARPSFGRLFLILPQALLIVIFAVAIFGAVLASFTAKSGGISFALYTSLLSSPIVLSVAMRTLYVAALVTVICVLLGYPLALFLSRSRHRNILLIVVISPWLTSLVVRTFGWIVLLGNRGALNSLLKSIGLITAPIRILNTPTAVVIGLVHVFVPFMVISILSVLQQQDKSLREAGMSLGAGPMETFARVTLPLSLPGVLSGCSIVYLLCAGSIVTPLLLGGLRDRMLGTQIFQELFELYDFQRAAAMAVILLLFSLLIVVPLQICETRVRKWTGV
jgi:putative spermidine/putrescine transport system permease protein